MPLLSMNGVVLEVPPAASLSVLMWRQLAAAAMQQEMRQVRVLWMCISSAVVVWT